MSEATAEEGSLASRAGRGGLWLLAGRGCGLGLRLVSNLVLTRLLAPEAFGLMALVQSVAQGVKMFSDLGIRGSVVQDPRGEEQIFLDTAWTIQILRGVGVSAGLALLAWPAAIFYGDAQLRPLLLVIALSAALDGLGSTAIYTLIRRVKPGPQVVRDLAAQLSAFVVTLAWAWYAPSVWALVGGSITSSLVLVCLSHRLIPGYRNRLAYDRVAARSIVRFGRWILVATAMTFLFNQSDRLVLGKLVSAGELGVYAIAAFLALAVPDLVQLLVVNILFPIYVRISGFDRDRQRRELARYRAAVLAFGLPPLWLLAIFGRDLVGFLYDPRYAEAGWMLQILAVGMLGTVVSSSAERVLLARGDSFSHMILQACQATLLLGGMWVGGQLMGLRGLLIGVSAARLLAYLPLAVLIRRHGVWQPAFDSAALLVSLVVVGLGQMLRGDL
jgi:O-antigen/teichoic acid export membrane protein